MGHLNRFIAGLLVGGGLLVGCGDPPIADVADDGGNTPNPTGVIEGTVTYMGPRPLCEYEGAGKDRKPSKLRGTGATLILYGYKDPGPPDGPPPSSALVVPANAFFGSLADCMPENPTDADLQLGLTRTAPFKWPNIPLGQGVSSKSYRIEALFDRDGDYYPLFLTHNIPTNGDLLGGALKSFGRGDCPNNLDCLEIKFDGACDHEVPGSDRLDGQVVKGISVSVALQLWTERPMFEPKQVNDKGYMSSEQTIDLSGLSPPVFDPDARRAAYDRMRSWGGLRLSLIDPERASLDCKDAKLPKGEKCVGPRLARLGLDLDLTDSKAYAWNLWPYDADGDSTTLDLHPMSFVFGPRTGADSDKFIFSENTPWKFPLIFLSRQQSKEEKLAAIPSVGMIGGTDVFVQEKHTVFKKDLDVTVLPTATMTLPATDGTECEVDIYPAGNPSVAFSGSGRASDCQEIPPGDYGIVVIAGLAGSLTYVHDPKSETGFNLAKAPNGFIPPVAGPGQLWLVPNDLGDPSRLVTTLHGEPTSDEQTAAEDLALPSQGVSSLFKVRDPHPSAEAAKVRPFLLDSEQIITGSESEDGMCHVRSDCGDAVVPGGDQDGDGLPDNDNQGYLAPIDFPKLAPKCCAPETVALCDVPLCEPSKDDKGARQPVRLKAWLAADDVDSESLTAADVAKLDKAQLTLAEAAVQEDGGKTVVFEGLYREALPTEKPDLIRTRDPKMTGEVKLYLTYDELQNPPKETSVIGSPDCDALRNAKTTDTVEPSATIRLKRVGLTPSCVPFLMPAACCNVKEPANLDDGKYGSCGA